MINRYAHNNLTWIDLESPTKEEVAQIVSEFKIRPVVAEELTIPTQKPKAELHDHYIFLILHFPEEIDFIIGKEFIITSKFSTFEPVVTFAKAFEVNSILSKEAPGTHAGLIFFYLIKKLYTHIDHKMDMIRDSLVDIENKIFEGKEKEMVMELSRHGRALLDTKQVLAGHKETLLSFDSHAMSLLGKEYESHVNTIHGEYSKTYGMIISNKEFLEDLRDTNDSLLTTKQNETLKLFTILAFVTFPLSLIVAIMAFPSPSNPIIDHPNAFWIIVATTLGISLLMFSYFKYKKWL